jgi:hypothetical protein
MALFSTLQVKYKCPDTAELEIADLAAQNSSQHRVARKGFADVPVEAPHGERSPRIHANAFWAASTV